MKKSAFGTLSVVLARSTGSQQDCGEERRKREGTTESAGSVSDHWPISSQSRNDGLLNSSCSRFCVGSGLLLSLDLASFCVLLLEPINPAFGVDKLLAAGKERMAGGANFNPQIAFVSRARAECRAAGAGHVHFVISGMNSCFHCFGDPFRIRRGYNFSLTCKAPPQRLGALEGGALQMSLTAIL